MIATASDKQTSLIRSLLAERVVSPELVTALEADIASGKMTGKAASLVITTLFTYARKPKAVAAPVAGTAAAALTDLPKSKYALSTESLIGLTGIDADGNDTLFFEVKQYKGVTYMRRLVGAPGDFTKYRLNSNDQKIVAARIRQDPKAAALLFSQKYTCCAVCAAPLTDQTSRDLGLGPICRNRF